MMGSPGDKSIAHYHLLYGGDLELKFVHCHFLYGGDLEATIDFNLILENGFTGGARGTKQFNASPFFCIGDLKENITNVDFNMLKMGSDGSKNISLRICVKKITIVA